MLRIPVVWHVLTNRPANRVSRNSILLEMKWLNDWFSERTSTIILLTCSLPLLLDLTTLKSASSWLQRILLAILLTAFITLTALWLILAVLETIPTTLPPKEERTFGIRGTTSTSIHALYPTPLQAMHPIRSEERRVGKEC